MEEIETLTVEDKPVKKKKLKKWVKFLLVGLLLIIIVFIAYNFMLSPKKIKSEVIEFEIEKGSSVYKVGEVLEKEGIIRSNLAYKIYVKLHHINSYKAGIYKLDKSYSTKDIVSILTGDYYKERGMYITFKEGKTIRGVAGVIAKNTNITENEFYEKLKDEEYIDSLINKYWFLTDDIKNKDIYYSLEGYLYPDTYVFNEEVKVETIIESMLNKSDKVYSKYRSLIDKSTYSAHEIFTLASVIEQEGKTKEDRKEIAGVFYNRLKNNISLGSDVTTYYAFKVEMGERSLTINEYNTINPYNTRPVSAGGKLPVGPISNFSEDSLDAAINPNKTDNLYFVADKYGKVYFTKTMNEHEALINKLKSEGNWLE